jgi:hypothetical protein
MLALDDAALDINCYGVFMAEIPRRLGRNPALDSAVAALMACFPHVRGRGMGSGPLRRFGVAVREVRRCLDQGVGDGGWGVEMLCATYFLMVCQVSFLGLLCVFGRKGRIV